MCYPHFIYFRIEICAKIKWINQMKERLRKHKPINNTKGRRVNRIEVTSFEEGVGTPPPGEDEDGEGEGGYESTIRGGCKKIH